MFLISLIFLHLINAHPQFNLYYTDEVYQDDNGFYHDCLRVTGMEDSEKEEFDVGSFFYCFSESPSQFHINIDKSISKFTFDQLKQNNISVQQLFNWSAPIDLIENYQIYLNKISLTFTNQTFYNCSLQRFGLQCQYELVYYPLNYHNLTLYNIIHETSLLVDRQTQISTCYVHLKCDYSTTSICLDWTDICNGQINCLNDGIDEKDCWQLEVNQCNDHEYRCTNGICIPNIFYDDNLYSHDCLDKSDYFYPSPSWGFGCTDRIYEGFGRLDRICDMEYFTSSCEKGRDKLIYDTQHLQLVSSSTTSYHCWLAVICFINKPKSTDSMCQIFCQRNSCLDIIQSNCSDLIFYPNFPVLFGNIYFAYNKTDASYWNTISPEFVHMCYQTTDYDSFFMNIEKISFGSAICVRIQQIMSIDSCTSYSSRQLLHHCILSNLKDLLKQYHRPYKYNNEICNRTQVYQCWNSSKCISIYRLFDRKNDCPYMDDENLNTIRSINTNIINILNKTHYKCPGKDKYVLYRSQRFADYQCDSAYDFIEQEQSTLISYLENNIVFDHICDGYSELLPISIGDQNYTDETECQYWPCNHVYTRCNDEWNCPTIEDEIGCPDYYSMSMNFNCSSPKLLCVSKKTYEVNCLSSNKIDDGHIDCLGGTDELLCTLKFPRPVTAENYYSNYNYFHCMNNNSHLCISYEQLCDGNDDCEDGNDEQFCSMSFPAVNEIFPSNYVHFKSYRVNEIGTFSNVFPIENEKTTTISSSFSIQSSIYDRNHCQLGLSVRIRLNHKNQSSTLSCFCPPNYYGSRCQYQNQRISVALKFQVFSDSHRILFAIVILLIDNTTEKVIQSAEQFLYLSAIDCEKKFNVYLLYTTRPKQSNNEYAIHIDIYEKQTLKYRASFLYPVQFPFLPVHRLLYLIKLPSTKEQDHSCLNSKCVHGKCIKYLNNLQNYTFCQCDRGWTGKYCNISYDCQCSSDAKCLGVLSNHRSICLCPPNRYGSRCFLDDLICQINGNSTCLNDGKCISDENHLMSNQKLQCLCKSGYSGDRCEIKVVQLNLTFEHLIIRKQKHVFIHFLHEKEKLQYVYIFFLQHLSSPCFHRSAHQKLWPVGRRSTFRIVALQKDFIIIHWSKPFYTVFVELAENNFYLIHFQFEYNRSATLNKTIRSSDYCSHVNELFNQTIRQWHSIRQIKYYHLLCQNQSLNLSCFRDDKHLCVCYDFNDKRLSNCFEFDFNLKYDCPHRSVCENDGVCIQDDKSCPTSSICLCKPCYHGRRCQYRTSGFGLSLEGILGLQILPMKSLSKQPTIILTSFALILLFMLIGLANGIVSWVTFKNKSIREVGCGLYLLTLSIISIILMIVFQLKFIVLLLTQMTILQDGLFLKMQCHSLDYLIQVCLCLDQWLNACVAIERFVTTKQGAKFNKEKSRNVAKEIIFLMIAITMASLGHDPYFRLVFVDDSDDEDEFQIKRTWCIVRYSSRFQIYNSFIHSLHFFGPVLCNIVSSVLLIVTRSHQQENLRKNQSFKTILRKQLQEHKHLLTAPIILVVLALPRLILTYLLKCMESESDAWLYLCIYLATFIPSMLTFVIFILPSKFYKKEFQKSVQQYRTRIRHGLGFR